jgi:hypothetical protein
MPFQVPCVTLSFFTKVAEPWLFRVREALADEDPIEATTLALVLPLTVPAVAAKVVEVAPAVTVAVAGTVRAVVLLERLTLVPPVGATLEMFTVQVAVLLAGRTVGAHASEDTVTGATRETEAVFEDAPSVAVTTALWSDVKVPAVAVKVALAVLAGTVTEAGTTRLAVLLVSAKVAAVGVAEESVAVQTAEAPVLRDAGVQVKALIPIVAPGDTVPPVVVKAVPTPPAGVAPIALITLTVVLPEFGLRVNDRTATTPFAIVFAFIP